MTTPAWADEPGLSQVVCGCLGELFEFVVSLTTIRVICAQCHQVNGEFPVPDGWQPFGQLASGPLPGFEGVPKVAGAPSPLPSVGAGWVGETPGLPHGRDAMVPDPGMAQRDTLPNDGGPPPASEDGANAVLADGTWPGRLLALPDGVDSLALPDGTYVLAGTDDHGRRIYRRLNLPGE